MTLQEQLADAKAAYQLVVTGKQANVIVDANGERVQYAAANIGVLAAYIRSLEAQIQGLCMPFASRGPIGFTF